MAKITIRKNFKFADLAKDLVPGEGPMREGGDALAQSLKQRARSGRGEDGRPLAPTKDKALADLTRTGQTLDDMTVTHATDRSVRVGFKTPRSERIADYIQNGTRTTPARPFLGPSETMIRDFIRRVFRRTR